MTGSLTERYDDRIAGVLSCYDRVVVTGTLPTVCYAAGMTKFLHAIGVRIFDYPQFASTLRDRVRERAASLAAQAGITIEHIAKSHIRKEAVVAEVLKRRGEHPGLVHVISAMEACGAYQPWHDKQTHKTFVASTDNITVPSMSRFDGALGLVRDSGHPATQASNNPPCFRYSMKNGSWPSGVIDAPSPFSHST